MSDSKPRVTVLIPVHNAEHFVVDAIKSVLAQTFDDFELLIIDDGSTDSTPELISQFGDPRIRLVFNSRNMGVADTLNRGLDLARGDYIARMDADDLCRPRRLERQVDLMDSHQEVVLCGTWYRRFGSRRDRAVKPPLSDSALRSWLFVGCPIAHPTVMIRRSVLLNHEFRYDPRIGRAEDYDLWSRLIRSGKIATVPEILLDYREHAGQVTTQFLSAQINDANVVRKRFLLELLPEATDSEVELHLRILGGERLPDEIATVQQWLERLLAANARRGIYDEMAFREVIGTVWYWSASRKIPGCLATYLRSPLEPSLPRRLLRTGKLLAKSLLRRQGRSAG